MGGRRALGLLMVAGILWSCQEPKQVVFVSGRLMVFPGALDFSQVALHDGKELPLTLTNVGRSRLDVQAIWVEGAAGAYSLSPGSSAPCRIVPGASCTVRVRFAPPAAQALAGRLIVRTDVSDGDPLARVPLAGVGVDAQAHVDARVLDFGRIEAQSQETLPLTLSNASPLPVQVTPRVIGQDQDEFSMSPLTLQPGAHAVAAVTFAPQRVGRKLAALAVQLCKGCAFQMVSLLGEALDKAVVAEPWSVDFGQVASDMTANRAVQLHNISTRPATVTGMSLAGATDPSFAPGPAPAFPLVLQPDQVVRVPYAFSPAHMNGASGLVAVRLASVRNPVELVGLTGFGGAPVLCVSPMEFDYGTQPVGSKTATVLDIRNCGTSNANPIAVQSISFSSGNLDQFSMQPVALPVTLAADQALDVKLFYEPTRPGPATVTVTVQTSVNGPVTTNLQLGGEAQPYPPCDLSLSPARLDFGTLLPGRGAVLGIKVVNQGGSLCALKDVQIVDSAAGRFQMPGGVIDGLLMDPGSYFSFEVSYMSTQAPGAALGLLQMQPAGTAPITVPLSADTEDTCLTANPWFIDFGLARPDCPVAPRKLNLINACTGPVTIGALAIGPGTTDGEFSITGAPATPITLQPGDGVDVTLAYRAQAIGLNLSPLFISLPGLAEPMLVPLLGESSQLQATTDSFVQQAARKVDILLVVDNSESMADKAARIQAAIPAFVGALEANQVDFHVAVTTTGMTPAPGGGCPGGAQGGEAGRFFPVDNASPRIVDAATPGLVAALQEDVAVGHCQVGEEGFEPMRRALSSPLVDNADDPQTPQPDDGNLGFLRDDAAIAVVFISDDDDHSPDDVATYVQFIQSLKNAAQPQRATLYAVAVNDQVCPDASNTGTRYLTATQATGGDLLSICAPDYSPLLVEVAGHAYGPQTRFPLSHTPDAATLQVTVDGAVQGSGWTYDAASNSVVFAAAPPAGATVRLTYTRICG